MNLLILRNILVTINSGNPSIAHTAMAKQTTGSLSHTNGLSTGLLIQTHLTANLLRPIIARTVIRSPATDPVIRHDSAKPVTTAPDRRMARGDPLVMFF